ncbi:MAG: PTS fructose transporter subunit IIA [Chromatiales bacterium]|nr:PTS fructose transporter subunit IIA [Chromatiales bacterium]
MSIGLLLITHSRIGDALLETVKKMFVDVPLPIETLTVSTECNPDQIKTEAHQLVENLNDGDGVLVFTDMYGSTPSNIAYSLADRGRVNVVSGLNLPMLIRTLNYLDLDLKSLTEKAVSGGREGIHCCERPMSVNRP